LLDRKFHHILHRLRKQPDRQLYAAAANQVPEALDVCLQWTQCDTIDIAELLSRLLNAIRILQDALLGQVKFELDIGERHERQIQQLQGELQAAVAASSQLADQVAAAERQDLALRELLLDLTAEVSCSPGSPPPQPTGARPRPGRTAAAPKVDSGEISDCYVELDARVRACEQLQAQTSASLRGLASTPTTDLEDRRRLLLRGVPAGVAQRLEDGDFSGLGDKELLGAQFERRWRAEGSTGWNVVVVVAPCARAGFLRAARAIRASSGVVVAPYLTALGRSVRKQHLTSFARLQGLGLEPRWRGAAGIEYTDPCSRVRNTYFYGGQVPKCVAA
jgi:hypothetical protein